MIRSVKKEPSLSRNFPSSIAYASEIRQVIGGLALVPMLLALISWVSWTPAYAETPTLTAKLDKMFADVYSSDAPGVAVLVKKGDEILLREGYGLADMELGVAIEPGMVFRLGSITKQFSAVAIMKMVEQGKLRLDQPLADMLPDYPDLYDSKVTLEHLLSHTSGIPSYTAMQEFWQHARKDHSVAEMLDYFDEKELEFEPGEKWAYNNSGYFLLGAILEEVSGKTYAEVMDELLFGPLGLTKTSYGEPTRVTPGRVEGYQFIDGEYRVADFISMTAPYAAGSLLSNVDDLARWKDALKLAFEGGQSASGNGLLSKASLERMWTESRLNDDSEVNYGFGWQLGELEGIRVIHHGGGIHGFATHALWLPEPDIFVAVLSNGHLQPPQMLSVQAAALVAGKPFVRRRAKIASDGFKRLEGVYQIDEDTERVVRVENGALTTQRSGGPKMTTVPSSATEFFYEDSLTRISFELDESGNPVAMWMKPWDQEPERAALTDKPLPSGAEKVELSPEQIDRLVGQYELLPGFILTVSRDGNRILTQATGQGQIEVFATSPTELFNEAIGARVVFDLAEEGPASGLTLFQGGQELKAARIKPETP